MEKIFLILLTMVFFELATAAEFTIVEVKRNIPLSDVEPVYKDYYIQVDSMTSLKKNATVLAKRKLSIRDSAAKSVGEVETPVGLLKIIAVGPKVAVAREVKLITRESEAMLEQPYIMVGDLIDTSASPKDFARVLNGLNSKMRRPASNSVSSQTLPSLIQTPAAQPEKNTQSPGAPTDTKISEPIKAPTEI